MIDGLPLMCSVVVTKIGDVPAIELRRKITDDGTLRNIVWCALHDQPIVIIPKFNDRIKSIASLIEKGIVYYDSESEQYYFTDKEKIKN